MDAFIYGNAGAIASLISTGMLYPCENVKTRMQVSVQSDATDDISSIIKVVLQKEGVAGFYRGITPLLIGNYISYGVYFFWYEYFKRKMNIDINNPFAVLKPSFISAILTTFVTNPFWVIQSRQTVSKDGQNFYQTTKQMIRVEGITSLFKGLTASLALVINPIVQFLIYEIFKRKFRNFKFQWFIHFFGGAISKAIATLVTYVFNIIINYFYSLIRSQEHMLMYFNLILILKLDQNNTDYLDLFYDIINKMGLKGLYRGLTPKITQSVLNSAFMLMFYERFVQTIYSIVLFIIIRFSKKA